MQPLNAEVYTTEDLPQADSFELVLTTVRAVAAGANTHEQIAAAIGNYTVRQGAYYRKAAELLGLVQLVRPGTTLITPEGRRILAMTPAERYACLATKVAGVPCVHAALTQVKSTPGGCTVAEVCNAVAKLVPSTTSGMIRRRVTTILSWLKYFDLVRVQGGIVRLLSEPTALGMRDAIVEPVGVRAAPTLKALRTLPEDVKAAAVREEHMTYLTNIAAQERASASHERLVSDMARHLLRLDIVPHFNSFVDLYAQRGTAEWLFEMKSCDPSNVRDQVRSGLAQLYEYRYLQDIPHALPVLVLETRPSGVNEWLIPYITEDRQIGLVWSDGRGGFKCPASCRRLADQLAFGH
jgi:hypothetical protein